MLATLFEIGSALVARCVFPRHRFLSICWLVYLVEKSLNKIRVERTLHLLFVVLCFSFCGLVGDDVVIAVATVFGSALETDRTEI